MHSFAIFLAATASLVSAQSSYYIVPDTVALTTRQTWCTDQTAACPLICLQTAADSADTVANTCNATSLTYSCICSNGISPNVSEYSQTLPYFICTQWGNDCVANCSGDATCAYNCRANNPCGAQNPTRVNTSTISSSMTKTASSSSKTAAGTNSAGETTYATGFASEATSTSSSTTSSAKSAGNMAIDVGSAYGLFLVAAGMFGGFALVL